MKWNRYKKELDTLKDSSNERRLKWIKSSGNNIIYQGQHFFNFASNDYLALAENVHTWRRFLQKSINEKCRFQGGSTSSRLLTGNFTEYRVLEALLAKLYNRESALIYNSGYHANIGILPSLTGKNDLILADKLVHASLIDGIRLSNAKSIRYRHNDYTQLETLLEANRDKYDQVFIVSESIFSMDGDLANLNKLVELKNKYNSILYIDEAHAFGVRGIKGMGLSEELKLTNEIEIIVGTLGKAAASQGAYVISDEIIRDYLINTSRSFIFSTALSPGSISWSIEAVKQIEHALPLRKKLNELANYLRNQVELSGFRTLGDSHIVPVLLGENELAVSLSEFLLNEGFYAPAIKPPTVAEGTARLRISVTAGMSRSDIDSLVNSLNRWKNANR